MTQQWDYAFRLASQYILSDVQALKQFGEDGWELVAITPNGTYILKRPLRTEQRQLTVVNNETGDPIDPPKKRGK
jgi:hypothetical protein